MISIPTKLVVAKLKRILLFATPFLYLISISCSTSPPKAEEVSKAIIKNGKGIVRDVNLGMHFNEVYELEKDYLTTFDADNVNEAFEHLMVHQKFDDDHLIYVSYYFSDSLLSSIDCGGTALQNTDTQNEIYLLLLSYLIEVLGTETKIIGPHHNDYLKQYVNSYSHLWKITGIGTATNELRKNAYIELELDLDHGYLTVKTEYYTD